MTTEGYRYTFLAEVPLEEVEGSLLLAVFAVESLHGESQVQLDAAHDFDTERDVLTIDASTPVGRDLCRVFTGFLMREFPGGRFKVERIEGAEAVAQGGVPAGA